MEALANAAAQLHTKRGHPTAAAKCNRALILLLAYTGLRWGEAAGLRVGRVDLDTRRIRVSVALSEVNGEILEQLPKTGERRTIPIPASLVAELKPLVDGRDSDAYVFTTQQGTPLRLRNWRNREFNTARANAGLEGTGLTPHKLRHTAASLAIAAGADVKVVQQMLGHATATMTLDTYGHLFPDRLNEVADAIDAGRAQALAG
ncbi:integrase [Lipingzhangella halophila]|uniref:Integrase n=1 Tax=Lipingzhangella halophila TaxID=1783352 RepID=A0A7W7W1W4_9ACTN|nr:site-specific integrase [Lipingzhangella halophila]MBB4930075.1 integrase [Lipingzhangella halophila]